MFAAGMLKKKLAASQCYQALKLSLWTENDLKEVETRTDGMKERK